MVLAHAFGQRYELPLPLLAFVVGGAAVVFLSFLLVLPRPVDAVDGRSGEDRSPVSRHPVFGTVAVAVLVLLAIAGITGSQTVPENILPTVFWVYAWVGVPLACGVIGDWTRPVNPFAAVAHACDSPKLRRALLGGESALPWPRRLGWWPSVLLLFLLGNAELVYNQTAVQPRVTGIGLLVYLVLSAFMGLLFGRSWLQHGEVFSVLFSTWGRLGWWRFGARGRRGFAGGLNVPFEPSWSRITFVLLLLVTVAFDGLLTTRAWTRFQHSLPRGFGPGTLSDQAVSSVVFAVLAVVACAVFGLFALAAARAGRHGSGFRVSLAGLLSSLVPISFGYLLAHYVEYLLVNGQLLLPLIGNPVGRESWPIHLPFPFNDSYEVHTHFLPSAFYWYLAVVVIVAAHVIAVLLAHRHLGRTAPNVRSARASEWPWIVAMVGYTMVSLWLLAQPLTVEKPPPAKHPAAESVQ
jgi:hypothetical protein